jgi:hypothetical protein
MDYTAAGTTIRMVRELEYTAPPSVAGAIAALGRTEDVCFSPSNRRVAVAGFTRNRISVFDIDITSSRDRTRVALTGAVELVSSALRSPHGLDFIDDDTLITTSRETDVAVFRVPAGDSDVRVHEADPLMRCHTAGPTLLNVPGSVSVTRLEEGLCEILICNNAGHTVTRHLLDRDACVMRTGEVLLQRHLDIPDGVSVSPDRRWIAVSNHNTHNVLLYQNSATLHTETEPEGILRGVYYPHGLRFSPDGCYLFVADAGAPYLHIYAQHPAEWRGVRHPVASVRIMDEAVFQRGRHNSQEGGPKGLDIDPCSNVLAVTSECQPLAFFDVATLLQHAVTAGSLGDQRILDITYELSLMTESQTARKAIEEHSVRCSRSWTVSTLLRRLNSRLRRYT